jgi:hypothetical protein
VSRSVGRRGRTTTWRLFGGRSELARPRQRAFRPVSRQSRHRSSALSSLLSPVLSTSSVISLTRSTPHPRGDLRRDTLLTRGVCGPTSSVGHLQRRPPPASAPPPASSSLQHHVCDHPRATSSCQLTLPRRIKTHGLDTESHGIERVSFATTEMRPVRPGVRSDLDLLEETRRIHSGRGVSAARLTIVSPTRDRTHTAIGPGPRFSVRLSVRLSLWMRGAPTGTDSAVYTLDEGCLSLRYGLVPAAYHSGPRSRPDYLICGQ